MMILTGYLHVREVLEDESLVELWVEVLPVHFGLVLGLFVGQQVDLDEGVGQPCRPVGGRQVASLDHLMFDTAFNILQPDVPVYHVSFTVRIFNAPLLSALEL